MYSDARVDEVYDFVIKYDRRPRFNGDMSVQSQITGITLKSSRCLTLDAQMSVKSWTQVMFDGEIRISIEFCIVIYQLGLKIRQFWRFYGNFSKMTA